MSNSSTSLINSDLTIFQVSSQDELPKDFCFPCVAELNKSLAFREKCLRTFKTLSAFYKMSDGSDDEKEIEILSEKIDEVEQLQEMELEQSTSEQNLIDISSIIATDSIPGDKINSENNGESMVLVYCINETPEDEELTLTPKQAWKCSICAMEFVRKKNFENHYQKYHEKEPELGEPKEIRLQLTKEKNEEDMKEKLKVS